MTWNDEKANTNASGQTGTSSRLAARPPVKQHLSGNEREESGKSAKWLRDFANEIISTEFVITIS